MWAVSSQESDKHSSTASELKRVIFAQPFRPGSRKGLARGEAPLLLRGAARAEGLLAKPEGDKLGLEHGSVSRAGCACDHSVSLLHG